MKWRLLDHTRWPDDESVLLQYLLVLKTLLRRVQTVAGIASSSIIHVNTTARPLIWRDFFFWFCVHMHQLRAWVSSWRDLVADRRRARSLAFMLYHACMLPLLSTDNCWSRILCAALSQLQLACSIEIFIFSPNTPFSLLLFSFFEQKYILRLALSLFITLLSAFRFQATERRRRT